MDLAGRLMSTLTRILVQLSLVPFAFAGVCLLIALVLVPLSYAFGSGCSAIDGARTAYDEARHTYGFDREDTP